MRKRASSYLSRTADPDHFIVSLSCAHNDWCPCCQIGWLVRIRHWHFLPRHHQSFIEHFEAKGKTDIAWHCKGLLQRTACHVHRREVELVLCKLDSVRNTQQERQFWDIVESQTLQRTSQGMIPHSVGHSQSTPIHCCQAGLSQEIGLPEASPWQTQSQ